jgi:vitamin B12 transporter
LRLTADRAREINEIKVLELAMSRKPFGINIGVLCITLALPATAQVNDADTVIVTGNRTGLDARQIGSAVTVITADDLRTGQMLFAKDALQDVPGVQISTDRPGAATSVYIRGSDNDQVLVLLDGLELGDPSNIATAFQFDHLNAADIERIEVLRGNQSSLYGSDAIGGVINVITRKPSEQGLGFDIDAGGGSYGMRSLDTAVSGDTGLVDYRFSASSFRADGPSRADPNAGPAVEDDAYARRSISAQLGFDLTPDLQLKLRAISSATETDLDGTGEDATFLPDIDKDESIYALTVAREKAGSPWRHELSYTQYEAERFYDASGDRFTGNKDSLRFWSAFDATDAVSLVVGLELESEDTDQLTSFSGSFIAGNDTDSVFAEVAVSPLDAFTLTVAARSDDNERFGIFRTHRVTAAYSLSGTAADTKLRASWGTGAKAPGLYQLFDPSFGDPELGVEESRGYDVGFDRLWPDGTTLQVSYFNLDIENEIDFLWPSGYLNRGETGARGLETLYSRPLGARLDWSLSYTYLASHDRQTGAWSGRPRNSATTQLSIDAAEDLRLTARARYRSMNAASFGGVTNSFVVLDLLGSYQVSDKLEVYARIVNLLDEDYQYEWGSSTYDRSVFAGVRLRH